MKMGYAPRKITGKHGKSLDWFEIQLGKAPGKPLSKSRRLKALRQYKTQKVS